MRVLCVIFLTLSFAACNGGGESSNNGNSGNESSDNEITEFCFTTPDVTGSITTSRDITLVVPYTTDRRNLTASFTTTGVKVMVGDTVQTSDSTPNDFTNPVTYTVIAGDGTTQEYTVTVQLKLYGIRERGPGGGWICYENPNYATDGWRYLEAAPADSGRFRWGTYDYSVSGAGSTSIGGGKQNTQDIINDDPLTTNTAAGQCAAYSTTVNGVVYDDWFLPSLYELKTMYDNLKIYGVGGFLDTNYQTSTEVSTEENWIIYFRTDGSFPGLLDNEAFKDESYQVRPCRRFQR